MTINGQPKRVTADYGYSKLTSRVEAIIYQKNVPGETFAHRYLYDADNRLEQVLVSRTPESADSWHQVAKYEYYLHGPLKNKQLGDYIQKVDYVYNINGWLKAINNPAGGVLAQSDADGNFAQDVFSEALNYYSGDYNRSGTGFVEGGQPSEDAPPPQPFGSPQGSGSNDLSNFNGSRDLFSGNISSTVTRTAFSQAGMENGDVMAQTYRYDLLNRFVSSKTATGSSIADVTSMAGNAYSVNVTYDANSNITTLSRTTGDGALLDQMTYRYATKVFDDKTMKLNNRLLHVNDAVNTPGIGTDMEDQGAYTPNNAA